jgi:hypothetical protein
MTAATQERGPYRSVDAGKRLGISGDNLQAYGNNSVKSSALVLDGTAVASTRPQYQKIVTSLSAAGAVALAAAQSGATAEVGDVVVSVLDMNAAPFTDVTSSFEATISVQGNIQQTVSTSGHNVLVTLQPKS